MPRVQVRTGLVLRKRFRVGKPIGRGAMGEVYEAEDLEEGGTVAVKLLHHELLRDAEWLSRFRREAEIALYLESPYIARVIAASVSGTARCPWVAFELLRGASLDKHLERDPRPAFGDVGWMMDHALRALEAAHVAGVIHRDIKPANLFIEKEVTRLRVVDFGIAKLERKGSGTSGLTRLAEQLGTPVFMSPEQLRSSKDVDARTDIYALGCVAFLLLTGRLPFVGRDLIELLSRKLAGEVPLLSRASGTTWPESVQGWISQTISPNAQERFSKASAARAAWTDAVKDMEGFAQAPASTDYLRDETEEGDPPSW